MTLHRAGRRVDGVRVRSHGRLPPAGSRRARARRATRASRSSSCTSRPSAPRPGQIACLTRATGRRHGTIARAELPRARPKITRVDDLGRDPRALPELLRGARAPAHPLGLAGALRARPLRAAHRRRDAPAEALLPRAGDAARAAPHELPEVLSHGRHRQRRQHLPPPHVLRDARQLLDRGLLQAEAIEFAWELSREVFGFRRARTSG